MDVWYNVMINIELAQHAGTQLVGGVVDLAKAFNHLPRLPIAKVLARLGVAKPVLTAWHSAVCNMQRRFKLRQSGPPLKSTAGYPEGCGLSVLAMVGANVITHAWMVHKEPCLDFWSYVDNLEIVTSTAEIVHSGLSNLAQFASTMDILLDTEKTYAWSTATDEREALRMAKWEVKLSARDWGGHVQYSKKVTNFTVVQRIEQTSELWNRLSRSPSPYKRKAHALKTKAWPRCLHGIASVHVGDVHYDHLRTGALRGLGEHTSGASPPIHLSLIERPSTDPQFYSLLVTLLTFRSCPPPEETFTFIMHSLRTPTQKVKPDPGPCSVLLVRLHQVGWTWARHTTFLDHWQLPCNIMHDDIQSVKQRLCHAWQSRVQSMMSTRKTFPWTGARKAHADHAKPRSSHTTAPSPVAGGLEWILLRPGPGDSP